MRAQAKSLIPYPLHTDCKFADAQTTNEQGIPNCEIISGQRLSMLIEGRKLDYAAFCSLARLLQDMEWLLQPMRRELGDSLLKIVEHKQSLKAAPVSDYR